MTNRNEARTEEVGEWLLANHCSFYTAFLIAAVDYKLTLRQLFLRGVAKNGDNLYLQSSVLTVIQT